MTSKTALLVMDVQKGIVGRVEDAGYTKRLATAVDAARAAGVPVIHVLIGFRPGHPEISPANKNFSALAVGDAFTPADPNADPHPDVAPRDGEVVVTKKRVSAFTGSGLETVLRARGYEHLVLAGVATSGVVLSTLRQAADLDYALTVLSDGCADADEEVHRVLTEKVFPRQADVVTIEQWAASLA
jgi:nicotinamidase-related amidase